MRVASKLIITSGAIKHEQLFVCLKKKIFCFFNDCTQIDCRKFKETFNNSSKSETEIIIFFFEDFVIVFYSEAIKTKKDEKFVSGTIHLIVSSPFSTGEERERMKKVAEKILAIDLLLSWW